MGVRGGLRLTLFENVYIYIYIYNTNQTIIKISINKSI